MLGVYKQTFPWQFFSCFYILNKNFEFEAFHKSFLLVARQKKQELGYRLMLLSLLVLIKKNMSFFV